MTIWRMLIACWIPKATNTHLQYVILIALPHQQWLHDRASLLRHSTLPVLLRVFLCSTFVCRLTDWPTDTLECNQPTCNWPRMSLHWTPPLGAADPQLLTAHHCQCVPLLLRTREILASNLGLISADLLGFFFYDFSEFLQAMETVGYSPECHHGGSASIPSQSLRNL